MARCLARVTRPIVLSMTASLLLLFTAVLSLAGCAQADIPAAKPFAPATTFPPTPSATITPGPPSVLEVFPLRLGATWVYSVTVDYDWNQKPARWTGTVTETVSSMAERGDARVFDVQLLGPPPDLSSWLFAINRYVARGNRVYRLTSWDNLDQFLGREQGGSLSQVIEWPLRVGQQWGGAEDLARGDGYLVWRVDAQENVTTPSGTFDNCFRLMLLTNPDHTLVWFCPNLGIARREYHHHGSRIDEVWELVK